MATNTTACPLHTHDLSEDCSLCVDWAGEFSKRMQSKADRINGKVQDLARNGYQPPDLLAHSIRLEILLEQALNPVQRMVYEEAVADKVLESVNELQRQVTEQQIIKPNGGLHVVRKGTS